MTTDIPRNDTADVPAGEGITLPTMGRAFKVGDKVKCLFTGKLSTIIRDDGDPEDEAPYRVKFEDGSGSLISADDLEMVEAAPSW